MGRTRITVKVEPAPKRWLSKQEAMAYLGVGEDFIDRLRNEALVSFSQFGRKIWYDLASLDRFILKNKVV
ncbi:DNA-binding protein [Bacteroides salyersiae]|uniref:DNA-binding protein n=1 Tax=Bacteroides salyersiae TaxID=291644 RepID=UPI001B8CA4B3|nr:DNA-binding protein [Bacteroides salyersiae]MBT9871963.1 DNA-binding protein [Bacteroides salyersiae]MCS2404472.1 helix-turn-helix domain-containing protein [Bacteroides salyersiae]QUT76141.1 hypothetical protein INE81_02615 [Bacteroides salyersiae]